MHLMNWYFLRLKPRSRSNSFRRPIVRTQKQSNEKRLIYKYFLSFERSIIDTIHFWNYSTLWKLNSSLWNVIQLASQNFSSCWTSGRRSSCQQKLTPARANSHH